ncbi:Uncharacterised protein [uncultured archaeon]|nr:Uncharacterised protein [uncultured archaeon]
MDKKEKEKEIQKLVSLTFDENPAVRKQAALTLASSDEPAATFALLELSYDKDESVKAAARDILSKKQPHDKDAISFSQIFGQPSEPEPAPVALTPEEDLKKKKLLSPVEQIFEKRLGKAKAALVKDRMMATIEKIYLKAVDSDKGDNAQKREKSMQKMLTSYADVLSGLDKLMFDDSRHLREEKMAEIQTIQETAQPPKDESPILEEVGNRTDTSKIARDLSELGADEGEKEEIPNLDYGEEEKPEGADKSIFRKAYDLMMATDGDEEVMFQQSQKLVKHLQEEVDLAFKMAKQRFKAANITHLTELKDGMRNVNTDTLVVKGAETGEYQRTKTKKDTFIRMTANDAEGSEGIIYLFEGRGSEVQPGIKIKVVKGQVKTFKFSGETAMTIGPKGSVYIVL